jgi:hypothetical protein
LPIQNFAGLIQRNPAERPWQADEFRQGLAQLRVDDDHAACHPPREPMNTEATNAIVELLFLAVYLDDRLSVPEDEVLEKALTTLGWQAGSSAGVDVAAAYRLASEAAACELKAEQFLRERTALLKAAGHSSIAFEWLGRVLAADGLEATEQRFLNRIQGLLFD